jgi:hypothetical protein
MYGYPKTIETKTDVAALTDYMGSKWATQENIDKSLDFLRGLIESRKAYFFDKNLAEGEEPTGSAPEYIVLEQEDGTRRQEALADDPNARIYRMGFTVDEVQALIDQIEGSK